MLVVSLNKAKRVNSVRQMMGRTVEVRMQFKMEGLMLHEKEEISGDSLVEFSLGKKDGSGRCVRDEPVIR